LWLADLIFGEGHLAAVAGAMRGEDAVETVDTLALDVEGGAGEGEHRSEVEIAMGTGGHWAMEAGGAAEEFRTIDLSFAAAFPPWHGSVEAHFPITRGAHVPAGEIDVELALRAETHSAETFVDMDLIGRLCQLISDTLAGHRERGPEAIAAAEARVADLHAASGAIAGSIASAVRSRVAAQAVAAGAGAELGVQLEIELHLGHHPSQAVVKLTDGFEAEEHGDGVAYSHARVVAGPITF
jgi:hypothetical protein